MKKSLIFGIVLIFSLFVINNVNAELYFSDFFENDSIVDFDLNSPIWSTTVEIRGGGELEISLINASWSSEEKNNNYLFINRGERYKEGDLVAFSGGNGEGPLIGEVLSVTPEGGIWDMRWIFFRGIDESKNTSIYSGTSDNIENFVSNDIKKNYSGYKINDILMAVKSDGNGEGAKIKINFVYEDGSFFGIDSKGNYLKEEYSFTFFHSEIVTYLNDGTNQYLSYFPNIEEDTKQKGLRFNLGCFKGAPISDFFNSILSLIFKGENPFPESSKISDEKHPEFLIDSDAENAFESEGRKIENTPGTGAYNFLQCSKLCDREIEKEREFQWENSFCYLGSCNKSIRTMLNYNECKKQCVLVNNCGVYYEPQSYDSYGLPGIKSLQMKVFLNKKYLKGGDEAYNILLNINPSTGKIDKKSTVNGKPITVLNEVGDIYLARLLAQHYIE